MHGLIDKGRPKEVRNPHQGFRLEEVSRMKDIHITSLPPSGAFILIALLIGD